MPRGNGVKVGGDSQVGYLLRGLATTSKKTLISPQFTSDPFQGLAVREKKKKAKTGENGNVTFC